MATKRNLKNLGRRGLSLFMAMVMTLSLIQISAFAANTDPKPAEIVTNGEKVTSEDRKVTIQKTAKHTGGNNFDITLTVTTEDTVTVTPAQAAHVVLVIDQSSSMNSDRMNSAKTAARTFAQTMLGTGAAEGNQIAVVSYGNGASQKTGLSGNYNTVKNAIDSIYKLSNGGTNIQAGIHKAQEILDADKDFTGKKVILVLSDGMPTYSQRATGTASWTGCYTEYGLFGSSHNWNWNKGQMTGLEIKGFDYSASGIVGNGRDYTFSNSYRAEITITCKHERTSERLVDRNIYANNGQPAIAEAKIAQAKGTEIYSVFLDGYGWDESQSRANAIATMQGVATSADHYKTTADMGALAELFKGIADSVVTKTEASQVVDPMGQFITLGDFSKLENVAVEGNTLTWKLTAEQAKTTSQNTKTYTITYPITLNTAAEGFKENTPYETNGTTTFNYKIGGEDFTLDFNVPTVKGYIPEYGYTVEYYKQGNAEAGAYASYTKVETRNGPKTDLHTSVSVDNYKNMYNNDNYHYVTGNTTITITANESTNVIKLYYDRDTTGVTVNHYYKLTTIAADGSTTVKDYPVKPDSTVSDKGYVGDSYEATLNTTFGGVSTYDLDSAYPNKTKITLSKTNANVIDLYYEATLDNRADATVTVDHVYRTHTWTLEDGSYVLKDSSSTVEKVESVTQKATTTYTAGIDPVNGNEAFTYDETSTNSITLKPGANKITLYFDKTIDAREATTVTVNHHYTKTVTTVDGQGNVTTEKVVDDHVESETVNKYVGESFTATEANVYGGETYTPDAGNESKLNIASLNSTNNVIDLYYTIVEVPEKTTVTVNHIYRTIINETVVTTDPETEEVTGTEVISTARVDFSDEVTSAELYVGESYTAEKVGKEGYFFNETASDELTVLAQAGNSSVIDLYYDKDESVDNRDEATIDVQHKYETRLTTIQDGKVNTIVVLDVIITEEYKGKAGELYPIVQKPKYNGNIYTVNNDPVQSVILKSGTNDTIVIDYVRDASDLVDTTYSVNYVYNTYTMTVNENGVAGYHDGPATENVAGVTDASGYVNEIVPIADGSKDGFTPAANNPATEQTLTDGTNAYTFVYNKYVPLDQVDVTVNHHYTTTTIAINGSSSSTTTDEAGTPVKKYVGETYQAATAPNGFAYDRYTVTEGIAATQDDETKTVTVTASGNVVVDFYYSKTVDNSVSAAYTIQHIYTTYDWDGSVISTNDENVISGSGFVTTTVPATTDDQNGTFTLVKATYNDETLAAPYQITLAAGANTVVFEYEQRIDTRVDTGLTVTVRHNYYVRDTYTVDAGLSNEDYIASPDVTPSGVVEMAVSGKDNGVWIGAKYTAQEALNYPVENGNTYTFVNATPADKTVELTAAGNYEIAINYIREISTDPGDTSYTIDHVYYTNGSQTGSTQTQHTGKIGSTVTADSITKVTSYGGNSYTYTSASPDSITLDSTAQTITLRYDRTTGGGGGGGTTTNYYYQVNTQYTAYDAEGNEIYSDSVTGAVQSTGSSTYTLTSADTATRGNYTFALTSGQSQVGDLSGTSRTNPYVFTVTYEFTEIGDIDTPTGELPTDPTNPTETTDPTDPADPTDTGEMDIIDEEVPLAEVPNTGDSLMLWIMAAAVSGMSLVWLVLSGKKRKDEEV